MFPSCGWRWVGACGASHAGTHPYCPLRPATCLEDEDKEGRAEEEGDEAAEEPAEPEDPAAQPHGLHGLLETCLLLVHHPLDDHGHGVDPGQSHEERQRAVQDPQEPGEIPPAIPPLSPHSWATLGTGAPGHDQPCATSLVLQDAWMCPPLQQGGHTIVPGSGAAPLLTHHPHSRGRASAGRRPRCVGQPQCAPSPPPAPPGPGCTRSPPRRSAGH